MSTENQNNEKPVAEKEKKELSPQQLQKRKKMIIFPLLFLLFAASMWLIFAPSEKKEEQQQSGLNTDLPTPKENSIISDKREAYVQEAMQSKQQEKMRSLQDFAFSLGEETEDERIAREERQLKTSPKPVDYDEDPSRFGDGYSSSRSGKAFQSSAGAYENVNRQLGNWYDEPATEVDEQSQLALEWRIQELERMLTEEQVRKSTEEQQLAMIEKSYAIAARYMNSGQQPSGGDAPQAQTVANTVDATNMKVATQPVTGVCRSVVSLLSAPMPDSLFVEEFTKPRNWGFNTAAGSEQEKDKNGIRACVHQTVTVTDGKEVGLRLLEPMMAGNHFIPANTVVTGSARITGERMSITVKAIQNAGNVIPVELMVYDLDGGQGVSVPVSEELNAVKEIAANMGSGMGSSITITDNAGSQLLSDLGRSAIQGASQYVGKKIRAVKVTLKAGYHVLLLPPMK